MFEVNLRWIYPRCLLQNIFKSFTVILLNIKFDSGEIQIGLYEFSVSCFLQHFSHLILFATSLILIDFSKVSFVVQSIIKKKLKRIF